MMHGRGKSDSAIVAGKSANKAERLAAEPTERRAGAKGNVDQQITCRAQNRESVSQAQRGISVSYPILRCLLLALLVRNVCFPHIDCGFRHLPKLMKAIFWCAAPMRG